MKPVTMPHSSRVIVGSEIVGDQMGLAIAITADRMLVEVAEASTPGSTVTVNFQGERPSDEISLLASVVGARGSIIELRVISYDDRLPLQLPDRADLH